MLEKIASVSVENGLGRGAEDRNLKRTCAEFESIFLTYLLKSRRGTIAEGGLLGNSHESQMVKSMFDENLAMGIARNGGMGLADMLYERLKDSSSDNASGKEQQTEPAPQSLGPGGQTQRKPSIINSL
jgi:Rod binding domain-containing protein